MTRPSTYSPTEKLYVLSKSPDVIISDVSESATQHQPLTTSFVQRRVNVPLPPHGARGLHLDTPNTQSHLYETQDHVIIPPRQHEVFYEPQPYHEEDTNNVEEEDVEFFDIQAELLSADELIRPNPLQTEIPLPLPRQAFIPPIPKAKPPTEDRYEDEPVVGGQEIKGPATLSFLANLGFGVVNGAINLTYNILHAANEGLKSFQKENELIQNIEDKKEMILAEEIVQEIRV